MIADFTSLAFTPQSQEGCDIGIVQYDNDLFLLIVDHVTELQQEFFLILDLAAHKDSELAALAAEPSHELIQLWVAWIFAAVLAFDKDVGAVVTMKMVKAKEKSILSGICVQDVDSFASLIHLLFLHRMGQPGMED